MTTEIQYPDVTVQLTGEDGNAFAIIGTVARALRKTGHREAADAFITDAMALGSYDDLLRLCMTTVDVS